MKRITKLAFALMLSVALSLAAAGTAFAATIAFEGPEGGGAFTITEGTEYHATDLFENFKNVVPGDERTQEVVIRNDSYLPVHVYLSAEAHDDANGLTYDEAHEKDDGKDQANVDGVRDETVTSANSFLSLLNLRVANGEKVIFDASPDQESGLAENVYLGTLSKDQSLTLDLTLSVPPEIDGIALDNAFANRVGEVDWVFTVAEVVYPDPPVTPDGPDEPVDPIVPDDPDEPLPDAGGDPGDPEKPSGSLGQTGDAAPLALLACVAAIAAIFVVVAALIRRLNRRF